jgi:hypothetical protein
MAATRGEGIVGHARIIATPDRPDRGGWRPFFPGGVSSGGLQRRHLGRGVAQLGSAYRSGR